MPCMPPATVFGMCGWGLAGLVWYDSCSARAQDSGQAFCEAVKARGACTPALYLSFGARWRSIYCVAAPHPTTPPCLYTFVPACDVTFS